MDLYALLERHHIKLGSPAFIAIALCGLTIPSSLCAQQQQPSTTAASRERPQSAPPNSPSAFPERLLAPKDVLDRGKAAYSVNCSFCHGSDAGGGSTGPNLQRSEIVLEDQNGELILPIVQGSRADRGMPKIDITPSQVSDIAAWLHSIKISSRGGHEEKINIVVGNAARGKDAFDRLCGSCHSVTGDLKGFAAEYTDPRTMQQAWIMPGIPARGSSVSTLGLAPVTATVTETNGTQITGTLNAVDDFYVAVTAKDGVTHRFTRNNGVPKVDIHDPLAPHREMLRTYNDKDIHDITAYLEALK